MSNNAQRQRWMRVLAKADAAELEALCDALRPFPEHTWLRRPETGLVMVRARIGGTGSRFNVGEMSLTRCALRLASGTTGFAFVQGRNKRHAELAALADALMQETQTHDWLEASLIAPLERAQGARRHLIQRKASATKVEFYTLARGDDGPPAGAHNAEETEAT